jgi:hypothetical protein
LGRGGPEQKLRFKLWWLGREKKRLREDMRRQCIATA